MRERTHGQSGLGVYVPVTGHVGPIEPELCQLYIYVFDQSPLVVLLRDSRECFDGLVVFSQTVKTTKFAS